MSLATKVKGQKPAPDRDLSSTDEIKRVFVDGLISKAGVLSRVTELFNPAGWYEPIKVQMKMSFQELTPLDWADKVPDDQVDVWVSHFAFMQSARSLSIPRYAFPSAADPDSRIRLMCLADAAEGAGGVAIYGGIKLPDGSYSCSLLFYCSTVYYFIILLFRFHDCILLDSEHIAPTAHVCPQQGPVHSPHRGQG
jgi:hypothetical protein